MSDQQRKAISIIIIIVFLATILSPAKKPKEHKEFSNDFDIEIGRVTDKFESFFEEDPIIPSIVTKELIEEESSVINVVEKVSPSVVSVVVETLLFDPFSGPFASEEGIGTGFIVAETGIIVTNSHVVDDPSGEYSVVLNTGETYIVETVHLDEATDLAILEINARGLPVVDFGDSNSLKVGQKAIAIGNALGQFSNTVTTGVVSGVARELNAYGRYDEIKTYEGAIQTDAALNPGNSGGPLLNSVGQVIGVNVATSSGADNIGFAIPVNTLKPILESFFEEGRIVRPFLGVSYTVITEEIANLRDFPEGAFVSRVLEDTPAFEAGIERGDIVIYIDNYPVNEDNSLSEVINRFKVGEFVELTVDRDGEILTLGVTLEESPENQ